MIPYGRQDVTQADIDAVVEVLRSDYLTQGPVVPLFERKVSSHVGSKHVLAMNSATSALHVACLALGLGPGDWLWTSPITFVASANCGMYCGAQVDFVDIDPFTYNICPKTLEEKLVAAEKAGKLPKVLVAVHMCGQSCEMEPIHTLSDKYGFRVIEDASHAIGGKYKGEFIGSCRYSDITIFSFHPVKIITTAEGGMALTNSDELAHKMALLRSHGITRDSVLMTHEPDGPWYYQQIELGYNYRMTELQAALGVSQIDRLDEYVATRTDRASRYHQCLASMPIDLPVVMEDAFSSWHLYVIRVKSNQINKSHKEVFLALRNAGIGVNLHYIPVHLQPYYRAKGFRLGDFPVAEAYYRRAISIPLYPGLTEAEQDQVCAALEGALN